MNRRSSITFLAAILLLLLMGCTKGKFINGEGNLVPRTVEQDPALPSVAVNGTLLHSIAFGNPDSAIIIVLHGGPGADFRSLLNCKQFADEGYRVVFYDQRGSGLSKRQSKEIYSLQLMYDDLTGIITHYKRFTGQKIFLLGHSWGAILATGYINKYPETINGVVLAEPGGLQYEDIVAYLKRAKKIDITSEIANDISYVDQFITGGINQHEILDYKYALLAVADGAKGNPTGNEDRPPFWRFGSVVDLALKKIGEKEKPNFVTDIDRFTTKILFAYSENNKAYGLQYAMHVSSVFSNVQLLKVGNAGHDLLTFQRGWDNFFPVALAYFNSLK